jgi:hypothetical protein
MLLEHGRILSNAHKGIKRFVQLVLALFSLTLLFRYSSFSEGELRPNRMDESSVIFVTFLKSEVVLVI